MAINSSFIDAPDTGISFTPLPETAPTKLDTKLQSVAQKTKEKAEKLGYSPHKLNTMPDADTFSIEGVESNVRASNFNAYETYHGPDWEASEYAQRVMPQQRAQLAAEMGVSPDQVTNQMVYQKGKQQSLESLASATGSPNWEAGPIDPNPANQPILGSKEYPMGVDVEASLQLNPDPTNKSKYNNYGRNLGAIKGIGPDVTIDPLQAQIDSLRAGVGGASRDEGMFLEAVDNVQSKGSKFLADTANMFNEASAWVGKKIGADPDKQGWFLEPDEIPFTDKKLDFFRGDNNPERDKYFGVSKKAKERQAKLMKEAEIAFKRGEKAWENEEYGKYIAAKAEEIYANIQNTPMMLSDSIPEMAAIMFKAPGIALASSNRTANQAEEFKKNNNGLEKSAEDIAIAFALNATSLSMGAFLIKTGVTGSLKAVLGKAGLSDRLIGGIGSIVGEYNQERFDTAIEIFTTRDLSKDNGRTSLEMFKAAWNSDRAKIAGTAGGTMAGTSKGAGETAVVAKSVLSTGNKALSTKLIERLAKKNESKVKTMAEEKLDTDTVAQTEAEPTEEKYTAPEEIKPDMMTEEAIDEEMQSIKEAKRTSENQARYKELKKIKENMAKRTPRQVSEQEIEMRARALETALLEDGVSPEDTTQLVNDFRKNVQAAGIAPKITTEQRKKGLGIETLSVKDRGSKKGKTFDPYKVTDEVVAKIAKGTFTKADIQAIIGDTKDTNIEERLTKHFAKGSPVQETIANILNSVEGKGKAELEAITDNSSDATPERALRVLSLALSNVFQGEISEKNVQADAGVQLEEDYIRESVLITQIGKEYVNSYGLAFTGDNSVTDPEYADIGRKMLAYAEEVDLISSERRNVPVTQMVDAEGKYTTSLEQGLKESTSEKGQTKGNKVVQENTYSLNKDIQDLGYAADVMARLFKPTNVEVPTETPVEYVPVDRKIGHTDIVKKYNKLEFRLKEGALELLQELKKRSEDYPDMDTFFKENKQVNQLLGTQRTSPWLFKQSEKGRKLNRQDSLKKILNNLDALEDTFHYNYESAINTRIHVIQTILEYQGDKYIARQLLTGGEKYTTSNQQNADVLVENIAEELDMEMDDILNPKGELLKSMQSIEKAGGKISMDDAIYHAQQLGITNPFKAMNLVSAVYDVYKAKGSPNITTDYMVEFDMTASGVVNTLMNLSGNPEVQEVLNQMLDGMDPYKLLNKVLDDKGGASYENKTKPVLTRLEKIGFSLRNIAKSPVMTWFYGSHDPKVAENMSHDIAVDLVEKGMNNSQDAVDYINEIVGEKKYTVDQEGTEYTLVENISKKDMDRLDAHFEENVAQAYVNALPKAFPKITDYRNKMGKIFTLLEQTDNWEGLIETAASKMFPDGHKYKMSVQKKKGTPMTIDEGVHIILNKMFNNKNSFNVNLQHSADAAQLLTALKYYVDKGDLRGVMAVHDAIYGDANSMLEIKQVFEKSLKDTAIEYDFLEVAINEAQEAINLIDDKDLKAARQSELDVISEGHNAEYEAKKKYLDSIEDTNFFGSKTIALEPKTETKAEATKPKPKPKKKEITAVSLLKVMRKGKTSVAKNMAAMLKDMPVDEKYDAIKEKVINALNGNVTAYVGEEFTGIFGSITIEKTTRDPLTDRPMTNDRLVEILGHEIDHATQYGYILDKPNSAEVRYLGRVVSKIAKAINNGTIVKKTTDNVWDRLDYIVNPGVKNNVEARQITELMSILRNEPAVLEELVNAGVLKRTVMEKIADAFRAAMKWAVGNTEKAVEQFTEENLENTLKAMEVLDNNAKVYGVESKKYKNTPPAKVMSKTERDLYEDAAKNPLKYAHGIVARQNIYMATMIDIFGDVAIKYLNPVIRSGHAAALHIGVYKDTVNLIRTGFKDSHIAQKMRDTIQIGSDIDEKIVNELLQIGDDIQQKTADYLTKNLSELDKRIEIMYKDKEDRKAIYETFTKTGLSGIQYNNEIAKGLINGDMTLEEARSIANEGISAEKMKAVKAVAKYYVTGKLVDGITNTNTAELFDNKYKVAVALEALHMVDKGAMLGKLDKKLKQELYGLSVSIEALSNEINEQQASYNGTNHTDDAQYNANYDGHYMMDVYNKMYEYKVVTKRDLRNSKYTSENDWIVVREPEGDTLGVIARENLDASSTPGVGLTDNTFNNGFMLSEEDNLVINRKLNKIRNRGDQRTYLQANSLVPAGSGYRIVLDNKTKETKLDMIQNVTHSLYRTLAHNSELIEMQAVRDIVTDKATKKYKNETELNKLNVVLASNRKVGLDEKQAVPLFLKLDYNYKSFDELPKWVKKYYKTPKRLTNYNGLSKSITLVKVGQSDVLLGHKNMNIFNQDGFRNLAKAERLFKQTIVMAKQHKVVASATKLAVDIVSNFGLLTAKDVSLIEIKENIPEGFKLYTDFSKKRGEIVQLELQARMGDKSAEKKLIRAKENLKKHKFYKAFKAGFVQSYSTSLVVKDFDTVSGLQATLDELVESMTKDKKGNPNEIYNAIKWWQQFGADKGLTVDSLVNWASDISKIKGTDLSTEMKDLAKRLKAKKDVDSVARYVGDIIGSPASEAVTIGGAVMVTADVLSKYTLAKSLMDRTNLDIYRKEGIRRKYTEEEAYEEANRTFIDYRRNMPSEVKVLSDYGILLFPNFWIKAQKVIINLIRNHPLTSISSYSLEAYMDIGGMNFLDVNIANKISEGTVVNTPTSIIDWDTISPWI